MFWSLTATIWEGQDTKEDNGQLAKCVLVWMKRNETGKGRYDHVRMGVKTVYGNEQTNQLCVAMGTTEAGNYQVDGLGEGLHQQVTGDQCPWNTQAQTILLDKQG